MFIKRFLLFIKKVPIVFEKVPVVLKTADGALFLARDVTDCSRRCVSYDEDNDDRSIMFKTIPIISKNHPYCVYHP